MDPNTQLAHDKLFTFEKFKTALTTAAMENNPSSAHSPFKYPFLLNAEQCTEEQHRWFFENSPFKTNADLQHALSQALEVYPYPTLAESFVEEIPRLNYSLVLPPYLDRLYVTRHFLPWVAQHGSADNIEKLKQKIIQEKVEPNLTHLLSCQNEKLILGLLNHVTDITGWADAIYLINNPAILKAFFNSTAFQKKMAAQNDSNDTFIPSVAIYLENVQSQYRKTYDTHGRHHNPNPPLNTPLFIDISMGLLWAGVEHLLQYPHEENKRAIAQCLPLMFWKGPWDKTIELFETIDFNEEQLNLIAQTLFRHAYGFQDTSGFNEKAHYLQERLDEVRSSTTRHRLHSENIVISDDLIYDGNSYFSRLAVPSNLTSACLTWAALSNQPLVDLDSVSAVSTFLQEEWTICKSRLIGDGHPYENGMWEMEDLFSKTPFYLPWLKTVFENSISNVASLDTEEKKALVPIAGLIALYRPDYCFSLTESIKRLLNDTGELKEAMELGLMAATLCKNSLAAGLPFQQRNRLMNQDDFHQILNDETENKKNNPCLVMAQDLLKNTRFPQFQKWLPHIMRNINIQTDSRVQLLNEICYKAYIKPVHHKAPAQPRQGERF